MSLILINRQSKSHIIAVRNLEAKLIENLLPLGFEDDERHFNERPEYASLL